MKIRRQTNGRLALFTLLRQEALWLATGRNGVLGFAGFRKDAPRLTAGCFTSLKRNLDLPPRITHVGHAVWGWCSCFREALVELESKRLKGYGEFPPELAAYLDPRLKLLIERITTISEAIKGSARNDVPGRER